MKSVALKYKLELLGLLLGAFAGWPYWYFIGCSSGSCYITSKSLNSTLYGGMMGALLFNLFRRDHKNEQTN
jgi:hypothetical protein